MRGIVTGLMLAWAFASLADGQERRRAGAPIGEVRASVLERIRAQDSSSVFVLSIGTAQQFPTLGYSIAHTLHRSASTIRVTLDSILYPSGPLVLPAVGSAILWLQLDPVPGRVTLILSSPEATDTLFLESSADSLVLTSVTRHFVQADERMRWRYPTHSFAYFCGVPSTRPLCGALSGWIQGRPGVSPIMLDARGVHPYFNGFGGSAEYRVEYYRFSDDAVLTSIARCFRTLESSIKEAVGVRVQVISWIGTSLAASSSRSFHEPHTAGPSTVEVCQP